MRNFILFIIAVILFWNIFKYDSPVETIPTTYYDQETNQVENKYENYKINPFEDPYQENLKRGEIPKIKLGYGNFTANPLAYYELSAMIMSKKNYSQGWEAKIAPIDLALAWGELITSEAQKHISYSQRNRWYFFRYDRSSPVSKSYIHKHSANHHIVPANKNILAAVKSLKKKDLIFLKGYLVKIDGSINGRNYWWNTSLSRNDTGDGACEVFYVDLVKVDDKIYE